MTLSTTDEQPVYDLERLGPQIDAALARYVAFGDDCPARLGEAIGYAVLGPGKRLRPRLVLLAAVACDGEAEAAMPAACAVEMIHAYSLIHDDLPAMDDDDLRRGRPTCHKQFGEATAILAGDALLARAFEVVASEVRPASLAARCCAILAHAAGATKLVGGQAADLEAAERLAPHAKPTATSATTGPGERHASGNASADQRLGELTSIHRRKTGALFVAAVELGAMIADAEPEQLAALSGYGHKVGLAFQISDDLLDAGQEGLSFPEVLGVDESRQCVRQLVNEACSMIQSFGAKAAPLRALAQFIATRDR